MNARKQWGGGLGLLPCLAVVLASVVPQGCGGGSNTPTAVPTPAPTPTPAPVTRVISQGSGSLGRLTVSPVLFTTTAAGTVNISVDWTFASNDVDIFLARGSEPCTLQTFNNRTCGFVATEESVTMKPEKLTVQGLAAGSYTLYILNAGNTDESVAWQVTLTSASASFVPSASSASVRGGTAKAALHRMLDAR